MGGNAAKAASKSNGKVALDSKAKAREKAKESVRRQKPVNKSKDEADFHATCRWAAHTSR